MRSLQQILVAFAGTEVLLKKNHEDLLALIFCSDPAAHC